MLTACQGMLNAVSACGVVAAHDRCTCAMRISGQSAAGSSAVALSANHVGTCILLCPAHSMVWPKRTSARIAGWIAAAVAMLTFSVCDLADTS